MLLVVLHLDAAAAVGLADCGGHRPGHPVGIHDHPAVDVAGGAADRLDQRDLAAKEAFLIGVEDGHQRHLRQIEALAQQVDAHKHVELAQAQVAHDLDALQRIDVRVQVAHLETALQQVIGEILRHLLGERGHQHALARLHAAAHLVHQVVDLMLGGPDLDRGIDQAGGTDHLLDHPVAVTQLPLPRRGADADQLRHPPQEFLELQRPVVQRRWQPEAIVHQRLLAGAVAVIHSIYLWYRVM